MITQPMRLEALRELGAAEDLIAQARRHMQRALAIYGIAGDPRRDLERIAMDTHRLRSSVAMMWQHDCANASFMCSVATAPTIPGPGGESSSCCPGDSHPADGR